jgi:hypothetical protein
VRVVAIRTREYGKGYEYPEEEAVEKFGEKFALHVEVAPDTMKQMLLIRAEGHGKRVKILEDRLKLLAALAITNKDVKPKEEPPPAKKHWWRKAEFALLSYTTALRDIDVETSSTDDNEILLVHLKNATPDEISRVVTNTRDRLHAHKAAMAWLTFVAGSLPNAPIKLVANDLFVGYLTDVDHPTAMPSMLYERRGVQ